MRAVWGTRGVMVVMAAVGTALLLGPARADATVPTTVRVSVSRTGVQARTAVWLAPMGISNDGSVVLMASRSSRLVAGDTNRRSDVFVWDAQLNRIERESVTTLGRTPGRQANGSSWANALSPDGTFVLFTSTATNLDRPDTNGRADVFVRIRGLGTTQRVSVKPSGGRFGGSSSGVAISADGRLVLFNVERNDNFERSYLRDRLRHELHGTTVGIGRRFNNTRDVAGVGLSADGRMVAYVATGGGEGTLFIHDRATGRTVQVDKAFDCRSGPVVFTPDDREALFYGRHAHSKLLTLALWKSDGSVTAIHSSSAEFPAGIADDGNAVAFMSADPSLIRGDTNNKIDLFRRDLTTGATDRLDLSNTSAQIGQVNWTFGRNRLIVSGASLSGNGRYVAFNSIDPNAVPGDTNGTIDVFLRGPLS